MIKGCKEYSLDWLKCSSVSCNDVEEADGTESNVKHKGRKIYPGGVLGSAASKRANVEIRGKKTSHWCVRCIGCYWLLNADGEMPGPQSNCGTLCPQTAKEKLWLSMSIPNSDWLMIMCYRRLYKPNMLGIIKIHYLGNPHQSTSMKVRPNVLNAAHVEASLSGLC